MENLPKAISFIKGELEALSMPSEAVHALELSCEEIIVNVFNYAYKDTAMGEIELGVEVNPANDEIRVRLKDWGRKFDILSHPEPDVAAPLEQRGKGGLGIFLAKQLMNEILYDHDGTSNTVTLVKHIAKQGGTES